MELKRFISSIRSKEISREKFIEALDEYFFNFHKLKKDEITKIRNEYEEEKSKNQKVKQQIVNLLANRSEIESFFFECITELKKDFNKVSTNTNFQKLMAEIKSMHQIDDSKISLVQTAINTDKVIIELYDMIFGPQIADRAELEEVFPQIPSKNEIILNPGKENIDLELFKKST